MGKKPTITKGQYKPRKTSIVKIMMLSSLFTMFIGVSFFAIQSLGENYGWSPLISLGPINWGVGSADNIIVFVVVFLGSVWVGSFTVLMFMRKYIKKI